MASVARLLKLFVCRLFNFYARFMSEVFALGAKIMCNHDIAGLVNSQRQLCRENPEVVVSIGKGAKLGVEECQQQFKDHRWNCSKVARDVSVFGKVMKRGMFIKVTCP